MENVKKVCPHCGSSVFASILNVMSIIDVSEGLDNFKVLKSDIDNASINCVCKCVNCKNDVTEQDLIGGVQCAKCSEYVPQEDIDEDGLCPACAMLKKNNASPTELLRMLIAEQKKGSFKAEQITKKQDIAKKQDIDDQQEQCADKQEQEEQITDDKAVNEQPEETPKRRGRPKRRSSNKEEQEENTSAEDTSFEGSMNQPETINDLDTEQAPFPEVTEEDKALGEELPSFADEIMNDNNNQDSFGMFDANSDDQAF